MYGRRGDLNVLKFGWNGEAMCIPTIANLTGLIPARC